MDAKPNGLLIALAAVIGGSVLAEEPAPSAVHDAFAIGAPRLLPPTAADGASPLRTKPPAPVPMDPNLRPVNWRPRGLVAEGPIDGQASAVDPRLDRARRLATTAQTRADLTSAIAACGLLGEATGQALASSERRRIAAWAYNRRGELAIDDGDAQQALHDFQRAATLDETFIPALHNRAITLAELGRFDAALRDFDRLIDLDPRSGNAYRNRGEALASVGQLERAVFDLTAAIALGQATAPVLTARGVARRGLGEIDLAVADFNLAAAIDPEHGDALAERGALYAQIGNHAAAAADLAKAIQIDPHQPTTRRAYAWLLATCPVARLRDPAQAVRQAEQAMRMISAVQQTSVGVADERARYLDALAVALAADGQFGAATRFAEQAANQASGPLAEHIRGRLAGYRNGVAFLPPEAEAAHR